MSQRSEMRLGKVKLIRLTEDLTLASLIAQRGYGESSQPRIRYAALEQALEFVAAAAKDAPLLSICRVSAAAKPAGIGNRSRDPRPDTRRYPCTDSSL